jgi:diadenosine tetraphosphate (Ap4A) HIT family hydrolase
MDEEQTNGRRVNRPMYRLSCQHGRVSSTDESRTDESGTDETGTDETSACEACQLSEGRSPLPGGRIHETAHWVVEHCVGPLGLGTLIVKPRRHVTAVADLTDDEAAELGPLLRLTSDIAREIVPAEQVYNCLWSHAGGRPVHIHYVVQPVTRSQIDRYETYGPALQTAMFAAGAVPVPDDVERVADRARLLLAER